MAKIDLTQYGITGTTDIIYNPSYEVLFEEEMKPGLTGYDKGQVSELGAVNVMTGIYTGRSPKDKFIVMDENSKDTVWWNRYSMAPHIIIPNKATWNFPLLPSNTPKITVIPRRFPTIHFSGVHAGNLRRIPQ